MNSEPSPSDNVGKSQQAIRSPSSSVGENQQAFSKLITILGTIMGLLVALATGMIGFAQRKMEIQIPINATQTAEANRPLIVISTSIAPTATYSAETEEILSNSNNVDVILNNQNADAPSVQLIIRKGDAVIADLILPPGGKVPKINLPAGNYQVEARPFYPPITPRSADCQIQWQLGKSYTRDFVITSGEAIIQIQQFDLQPQEICPTGTPPPQTPTPGP